MRTKKLTIIALVWGLVLGNCLTWLPAGSEMAYAEITFAGGDGTEGTPYLIATRDQLEAIAQDASKHYKLTQDIDLSGTDWTPIPSLTGTFDGNYRTISNMKIDLSSGSQIGFIKTLSGKVKNVRFENASVTGSNMVGAVTGITYSNGSVEGVIVTGSVTAVGTIAQSGGIAGINMGSLRQVYVDVTVTGGAMLGGIAGINNNEISESWSKGALNGSNQAGGIVGSLGNGLTVENSFSEMAVNGTSSVGGMLGSSVGASGAPTGMIGHSLTVGPVTGTSDTGALMGKGSAIAPTSYWNSDTSNQATGIVGTGKAMADLKKQETFAGWNFTTIWKIGQDATYPELRWYDEWLKASIPGITPTTLSPSNNEQGVAVQSNLVLQFGEAVTIEPNKQITIKQTWDDGIVETISTSDASKVEVANDTDIVVNPDVELLYGSSYYVELEAGAFKNGQGTANTGISGHTGWQFETEIRAEVTANDSGAFAAYMSNSHVSLIHLLPQQQYIYAGGIINRALSIDGRGATIKAGGGLTDTVVRSDGVVVDSMALANYANVKTFLAVEGGASALTLNNVVLENTDNNELFTVINVKTDGSLSLDQVTLKGFHNNNVPGDHLSFGIHAEPGALSTSITNSSFDSSNAFRNAVAIRSGAVALNGNTFAGTIYPERLKQSDGYEYAIYLYGGNGAVTGNTITGYDSTTQRAFSSAGIAVIGFYAANYNISDNRLAYNESGIDVTLTWTPWSSNRAVTVNGISLADSEDAFAMGEALRKANLQDYVSVSLDQTDEVELTSSEDQTLYYPVLGGYRAPFLALGEIAEGSAKVRFPADSLSRDVLNAAEAIELEERAVGQTNWSALNEEMDGTTQEVVLPFESNQPYEVRIKLTHKSHEDAGASPRTLVTYSNPVTVALEPKVVTYLPSLQATNVPVNTQLALVFNKAVTAVAGKTIMIKKTADHSVVDTIDAGDTTKVAVNGERVNMTLPQRLQYSTNYYVTIQPGAFQDGYGVGHAGLLNASWSFKTAAQPTSPSSPSVPAAPISPKPEGIDVLVNGKAESAGTASVTNVNGQKKTAISVDEGKIMKRLEQEGNGATITVPVKLETDVLDSLFNGRLMQSMARRQATIEIQTADAIYRLPAEWIGIADILKRLGAAGALEQISVGLEIAKPTAEAASAIEQAVKRAGTTLVAAPMIFRVYASYNGKEIEIDSFEHYVERLIALPAGVEAGRITTGVVAESDGKIRHVPTKVVSVGSKDYAQIHSLTNSSYAVVWNPMTFADVASHWSKASVNNMGSRMVVQGDSEGLFHPDRSITRAEFAAIVVRGLGLPLEESKSSFEDVTKSVWYSRLIQTAVAYDLIAGFPDGTFRPNDPISREQAMSILAKAMKWTGLKSAAAKKPEDVLGVYEDASKVSPWAAAGIADCIQTGIVTGRGAAELAPRDHMTRAEVASIIERLLKASKLI